MGSFTEDFENRDKFLEFYEDIFSSLADYLKDIEDKAIQTLTEEQANKLRQDLITPYTYLTELRQQELKFNHSFDHIYASIISFNYTSTIDTLCQKNIGIGISRNLGNYSSFIVREVLHIHGDLSNKTAILLGVDNPSQISNPSFSSDEDIQDALVKPNGNRAIGKLIERKCLETIYSADIIYIFGSSLGQTDQTWWDAIRKRFMDFPKLKILYYLYDKRYHKKRQTNRRPINIARQSVVDALGLEGDETNYRDRIFIAINSDMFPSGGKISID